jgi:hypothetical protein
MTRFNVGDWVEVVSVLTPQYMRAGRIIRVIPHPELPQGLDKYEVKFGLNTAYLYETQLRVASSVFEED